MKSRVRVPIGSQIAKVLSGAGYDSLESLMTLIFLLQDIGKTMWS
jgi:hypothetical protein